jgi:hypothetical protein
VRLLAGLLLLPLGAAVGLAAVWTHGRWWGLVLGVAATLAGELALPRGGLRLMYAAGWVLASAYFLLARPEGDYVVASDTLGYTFLGFGLVVLVVAVATVPPRGRLPRGSGAST